MKGLLAALALCAGCTYETRFEVNEPLQSPAAIGIQDKYALIVIGSSRGEHEPTLRDPLDRNYFFLGGVSVYKALRKIGFEDENMRFLYVDGNPDFTESINAEAIAEIKERQFNGLYDNRATHSNIRAVSEEFAQKVGINDAFIFYIGTHGEPFRIEIEEDGTDRLTPSELEDMLKPIQPKVGLLYLDACDSGRFIEELDLPKYVKIASTPAGRIGWADRGFSNGSLFFENLTDNNADMNHDGKITFAEAFIQTNSEAEDHMFSIEDYLSENYVWAAGTFTTNMREISVEQSMLLGEEASPYWYLAETEQ